MIDIAFDPEARSEFLAAIRYYEECRQGLGRRFRQALELELQKVQRMPFRFRVPRHPFRRCLVRRFPYPIIHTIEPDFILVVAVAHKRRKPEYWGSRIDGES